LTAADTVIAAEDAFFAAQTASDLDALGALFAPDLIFVHTTGAVDGRQSYLEGVREGHYAHGGIDRLHSKVVVSQDRRGAVTISVVDMMSTPLGKPELAFRICQVIEWSFGEAGWQIRSRQATKQPL
jgi:ketosteroid isomerase-like protein